MSNQEKKVVYRLDSLDLEGSLESSIEFLKKLKEGLEKKGYGGLSLFHNPTLNVIDIYGIYSGKVK